MQDIFDSIERSSYEDIKGYFIDNYVNDAFSKLSWQHDVFEAEYLTKKSREEQEYEEVVQTLSNLKLNKKVLVETSLDNREYVLKKIDLEKNDVVSNMRRKFYVMKQKKR